MLDIIRLWHHASISSQGSHTFAILAGCMTDCTPCRIVLMFVQQNVIKEMQKADKDAHDVSATRKYINCNAYFIFKESRSVDYMRFEFFVFEF